MDLIEPAGWSTQGEIIRQNTVRTTTVFVPRGGAALTVNVLVLQRVGTTAGTMRLEVEGRGRVQDAWTTLASGEISATGRLSVQSSRTREFMRLVVIHKSGSADSWMRIYVEPPIWGVD